MPRRGRTAARLEFFSALKRVSSSQKQTHWAAESVLPLAGSSPKPSSKIPTSSQIAPPGVTESYWSARVVEAQGLFRNEVPRDSLEPLGVLSYHPLIN